MKKNKLVLNIRNFSAHWFVKWLLIPFILFLLWLTFSMLFSSYKSFTVLEYSHEFNNNMKEKQSLILQKGDKLEGEFRANDKNLGIISVRVKDVPRVEFEQEDKIIFRIKEEGSKEWLYENQYLSGLFSKNSFFTFGFPEIPNSKDKSFVFEIKSLSGNKENSITFKNDNSFITKYKFDKNEVFENSSSLVSFAKKKILTFISSSNHLVSSIGFMLPLIFYLIWIIFPIKKILKESNMLNGKSVFSILISLLIFCDIIFYEFSIVGYTIMLIAMWVISVKINNFKSRTSFIFALILILFSVFTIYFNLEYYISKASTYAYLLLVIAIIQKTIEIRRKLYR